MSLGIEISDRIIVKEEIKKNLNNKDEIIEHYNMLKTHLKSNLQQGIYSKIENMKILKEIKDNKYYKLDGYKNFDAFIKDYKLAKTQTYCYLRIALAIENGVIEEPFLLENGIKETIIFLRNSNSEKVKKSKQNPIKPLRFQLKKQESYDFYKKNAKFTAFILEELLENQKDFLKKLFKKYEERKI
ncbi:chromosome replication/partitioning protein [Borreliella bissettiae]|uniref:Borrelia PFam49 partion protein n=1 Tax=Borrelia bissettiae (strain DSM 17990 / CIP 109136 / DN127) TaxID=521010 RepID=G0ANX0_BORBD|nr:chromosome replication/partitioning protein [Borreliella bissettiae]AEL19396.1 borrelia PFam49 partion protein [Borreliella bissettiae DN127]